MINGDYVRLGSACHCGEPSRVFTGLGRPPKSCEAHKEKQSDRSTRNPKGNLLAFNCAHCSFGFTSDHKNSMYCSKRCKLAAWKLKHGIVRKTAKVTDLQKAIRSMATALKRVAKGKRQSELLISKGKREEATSRTSKPCVICGGDCGYVFGRAKKYCSTKCMKQSAGYKRLRKAERKKRGKGHVQRAKKLGCTYSYFNVLKVFDRDKWICKLCGVKTPKSLRGTTDPRAPELDHILALALGGAHAIENCQCSCRACNGKKGAGSSGQMWLVGFA